uniref:Uncharacterized protein n=1 Tax=Chenopodium quinoa TaxID=63459 RepID=A0A803KLZ0_CHEQI
MASPSTSRGGGSDQPPERTLMRTQTAGNLGETAFDSDIVPSSLVEIAPILRVANEVEKHNPRVAYLFLQENDQTLMGRVKKSDAPEMQSFYQHFYKTYIQALQNAADKADRAQLTKAYQTADVFSEVLKAVNSTQCTKVDGEVR